MITLSSKSAKALSPDSDVDFTNCICPVRQWFKTLFVLEVTIKVMISVLSLTMGQTSSPEKQIDAYHCLSCK